MDKDIQNNAIIQRSNALFNQIDDELVLFEQTTGKYFQVNAVGARIWELIEQPTSLQALLAALLDEFEVAPDVCERETNDFIQQAVAFGFITVSDEKTT